MSRTDVNSVHIFCWTTGLKSRFPPGSTGPPTSPDKPPSYPSCSGFLVVFRSAVVAGDHFRSAAALLSVAAEVKRLLAADKLSLFQARSSFCDRIVA